MRRQIAAVLAIATVAGCGRIDFDSVIPIDHPDGTGDAATPGPDTSTLTTYRAAVLADTPLSYWRLDDSDTIARDELGHANGTYLGTCEHGVAGALADDPDTATAFDGSTCTVDLGTSFAFAGASAFTIELWVSTVQSGNSEFILMNETRASNPDAPIDGYAIVDSGSGVYSERATAADPEGTIGQTLPARFTQLVFTYDGATQKFFFDGSSVEDQDDARAIEAYTATLYVGGVPGVGNFVAGSIDEVSIYDHALSPLRIQLHHDIGTNGPQ